MKTLYISGLVVLLDQLSKQVVRSGMELYSSINILGNLVRFTYVENSGIAFGISVGQTLPIFTMLSIFASIVIFIYLYKERFNALLPRVGLALIFGGAIGNIIDRILFGKVVDFIDVGIGVHRFYIFNVADSAVTVGVTLYLIMSILFAPQRLDLAEE